MIRMITSSRMRCTGHVAQIGAKRIAYRILGANQKERDHWEDQDVGGRIILKLTLERYDGVLWTGLIWFVIRNEPSGSINCREVLE
jgi:hypothetical protein